MKSLKNFIINKNSKKFKFVVLIFWFILFTILSLAILVNSKSIFIFRERFFQFIPQTSFCLLSSIFSSMIILLFFYILFFSKFDKSKFVKFLSKDISYCIILFISIEILAFLIPSFNTPDEYTHINFIFDELGLSGQCINYYWDIFKYIPQNPAAKITMDTYINNGYSFDLEYSLPVLNIYIIRHLPQAIGFYVACKFSATAFIALLCGETFGAMFYVVVCFLCLKLLPIKKNLFKLIFFLPMCLQQAGSFNYDCMLLSLIFLYISLILFYKFKREYFKISNFLLLLLILSVISLIKLPYAILFLLILIIPFNKYRFNVFSRFFNVRKNKITKYIVVVIILLVLLFVAGLVLYFMRKNFFLRLIYVLLSNPVASTKLLYETAISLDSPWNPNYVGVPYFIYMLIGICGDFGWSEVPVSNVFVIFVYFAIFVASFHFEKNESSYIFSKKDLLVICLLIFLLIILINFGLIKSSIYLNGVPEKSIMAFSTEDLRIAVFNLKKILGLQGRYFIPLIPLALIIIKSEKVNNILHNINFNFFMLCNMLFVDFYVCFVIINRYWISF